MSTDRKPFEDKAIGEFQEAVAGAAEGISNSFSMGLGDATDVVNRAVAAFNLKAVNKARLYSIAAQSNCVRRQVGATLMNALGEEVASGYNHVAGAQSCANVCPRARHDYEVVPAFSNYGPGVGYCRAIHAEMDALNRVAQIVKPGSYMLITCAPCPQCAKRLEELDLPWYVVDP